MRSQHNPFITDRIKVYVDNVHYEGSIGSVLYLLLIFLKSSCNLSRKSFRNEYFFSLNLRVFRTSNSISQFNKRINQNKMMFDVWKCYL